MTAAAQKHLTEKVLALPHKVRARLARLLLESLDDAEEKLSPKEWDRAWSTELDKRIEEVRNGTVKCVSHAEARKRWNKILGKA